MFVFSKGRPKSVNLIRDHKMSPQETTDVEKDVDVQTELSMTRMEKNESALSIVSEIIGG